VYADLRPSEGFFYDTWDCGGMTVEAYMRVKGVVSPSDPRSLLYKGE